MARFHPKKSCKSTAIILILWIISMLCICIISGYAMRDEDMFIRFCGALVFALYLILSVIINDYINHEVQK